MDFKFFINKEQIARIKTLQNFIKKLESISPLSQTQLFVVEDDKLTIYGYGNGSLGSGNIQATFDLISDKENDNFYFSCSIGNFVKFLEKTKSDIISVTLKDRTSLTIKGETTKSVFNQTVLATVDAEVEEIKKAVVDYPTSNYYKASKTIKLAGSKDTISIASQLLALLNTNKFLTVGKKNIRVADDCSIIDLKTDIEDEASLLKTTANLFADVDEIKYYKDDSGCAWIYADVAQYGITLYFAQEPESFQCPTDAEIEAMSPKDEYITVSVKVEDLFNAFDEFKDVFSNDSWQYKQVSMVTDVNASLFKMSFDDMVTSVETELPFTIVENKEDENEFSMTFPFLQLNILEPIIRQNEVLTFTYSSKPEEPIIKITGDKNSFNNIIITKLMD